MIVTVFTVTLCDDRIGSSKELLKCVCMKRNANWAIVFNTILSNLALGHRKINRHFLERCRVEIIKLSSNITYLFDQEKLSMNDSHISKIVYMNCLQHWSFKLVQ